MQAYQQLLQHILDHGAVKSDRTGTGTTSVFGYQMRFDLRDSFPMVTTKKLHFKSIIHELIWFLSGSTNVGLNGVHGWEPTERPWIKFNKSSIKSKRIPIHGV